ncbi:MAG: hypothetical protein AAF492_04825, partial [Verrucomicrobiota bacterium]
MMEQASEIFRGLPTIIFEKTRYSARMQRVFPQELKQNTEESRMFKPRIMLTLFCALLAPVAMAEDGDRGKDKDRDGDRDH